VLRPACTLSSRPGGRRAASGLGVQRAVGWEVEAELDLEAAELDSAAAELDLEAAEVDLDAVEVDPVAASPTGRIPPPHSRPRQGPSRAHHPYVSPAPTPPTPAAAAVCPTPAAASVSRSTRGPENARQPPPCGSLLASWVGLEVQRRGGPSRNEAGTCLPERGGRVRPFLMSWMN